jgi:hypothetical protein
MTKDARTRGSLAADGVAIAERLHAEASDAYDRALDARARGDIDDNAVANVRAELVLAESRLSVARSLARRVAQQ